MERKIIRVSQDYWTKFYFLRNLVSSSIFISFKNRILMKQHFLVFKILFYAASKLILISLKIITIQPAKDKEWLELICSPFHSPFPFRFLLGEIGYWPGVRFLFLLCQAVETRCKNQAKGMFEVSVHAISNRPMNRL